MVEIRNQWIRSESGSLDKLATWRPRWRLLICAEGDQRSRSREAHRRMARNQQASDFSANAFCAFLGQLCVVTFFNPVGVEISAPKVTAGQPSQPFMNSQDRANVSRGLTPTTIYRLKQAALKAMGHLKHVHPRSLQLTPLPHTGGEVLLTHPNGWTGRGIAWREGGAELAIVWQVSAEIRGLPVKICA